MERRRISTKDLSEGMKLVDDVVTQEGQLLVTRGTEINQRIIARLSFYGIPYVYIEQKSKKPQNKEKPLDHLSYYKQMESTYEFKRFNYVFKNGVGLLQETIDQILKNHGEVDLLKILNDVEAMVKTSGTSMHLLSMLQCIRRYDDLIYVHSMNVALICNVFAEWLHMSENDKQMLTVAALLHDIGKTAIPKEVLSKTSKLTDDEFEMIRRHPVTGYELIKNLGLDDSIQQAILQHHERCDGTGYPNHELSANISDFAKIIAIADVYDAMTSNRSYREGICPFVVIDVLEKEGYRKYEPQFLLPFMERISQCYINASVRLSNGCEGEVIMLNPQHLSRPVIKVGNEYVNLLYNHYISIEAVI